MIGAFSPRRSARRERHFFKLRALSGAPPGERNGVGRRTARSQYQLVCLRQGRRTQEAYLVTLGALVIYRLGTYIPLPGIDSAAFQTAFLGQKQGVLDMFNMFSGGAVQRMAVFALNIMPYISASIIIQLLSSVVPSLEAIKKEGEQGRKVLNQYTRYLTVVLSVFQAYGIAIGLEGR